MTKKIKKKVKLKWIPFFLLLIFLTAVYFTIKYAEEIKIKNIYVYGNELLTDQEIIDTAGLSNYPSFIKTPCKSIKNGIKNLKLVKDVKIKKKLFNVIEIHITEYEPVFIKDNKIVLENGEKIDLINKKLPILAKLEENAVYYDLIEGIINLNDDVRNNISQIIYSPSEYDKERFLLYMDDGNHIYVNINKFKNLNYYSEIYPTLGNKKGTLYLDSGNHFEMFK